MIRQTLNIEKDIKVYEFEVKAQTGNEDTENHMY